MARTKTAPAWRTGPPSGPGLWLVKTVAGEYTGAVVEYTDPVGEGRRYLRVLVDGFSEPLDGYADAARSYGPISDKSRKRP